MQLVVGIAARGAFEAKIDAILPDVMSLRIRSSCRRRKFEPQLLIFDGESSQVQRTHRQEHHGLKVPASRRGFPPREIRRLDKALARPGPVCGSHLAGLSASSRRMGLDIRVQKESGGFCCQVPPDPA